jgi:hypothetical protein
MYPRDLRRKFGPEMADVFADQIWAAWSEGGTAEALRVWRVALWELITVGLPMKVCSTRSLVTLLSMVSSLALFLLMLWGIGPRCHK